MIALEKLLLLKSVPLFMQIPDDILLQLVSEIAREKMVIADETIIEKGGVNSTMYVIVSGMVNVHNGTQILAKLGEREIFGELSALTGQPPVSSVSAAVDCFLLTISSDALYELMSFESGLSKGLIQALCQRAQMMSAQLQALQSP